MRPGPPSPGRCKSTTMPCIHWHLRNFLAIFAAFDASISIFKTPNSSFPCQAFVSWEKQEMWALIAADWPHRAEIVQPGNYMSAASSEKQLVQQSLLDGDSVVVEASPIMILVPFHDRFLSHYSKGSPVGSLSPTSVVLAYGSRSLPLTLQELG
jgi:hypothetical protein